MFICLDSVEALQYTVQKQSGFTYVRLRQANMSKHHHNNADLHRPGGWGFITLSGSVEYRCPQNNPETKLFAYEEQESRSLIYSAKYQDTDTASTSLNYKDCTALFVWLTEKQP